MKEVEEAFPLEMTEPDAFDLSDGVPVVIGAEDTEETSEAIVTRQYVRAAKTVKLKVSR